MGRARRRRELVGALVRTGAPVRNQRSFAACGSIRSALPGCDNYIRKCIFTNIDV